MNENLETRYGEITDIEVREDNGLEISGYAIVFDAPSEILGGANGFREIITRTALNDVDLTDVYLFNQHKSDEVLGSTHAGTMRLTITDKGLSFRATLPETTLGMDTYKLVQRGDLKSMSFGFTVAKDTWNMSAEPEVRSVTQIGKLIELSLVTHPGYKQSSVNTRSMDFLEDCRECRFEKSEQETESINRLEEAEALIASVQN